jgi:two-component system OmpR family response regulator
MRVLVAEDDAELADYLVGLLGDHGHEAIVAASGDEAVVLLAEAGPFDVAVLDRMLPGRHGMAVLDTARAAGDGTPVLMLTALNSIADRVEGLEAGADDYLVKPFAAAELLARLNALGRRRAVEHSTVILTVGPLRVDVLRREAFAHGRLVALQPRELRLLEELMRAAGRVVTRTMLLEAVWHFHFEPQTNIVESHMSRLRSKLGLAGAKEVIETVRGAGYRLRVGR